MADGRDGAVGSRHVESSDTDGLILDKDDGLGPSNEDEDEPGLPEEAATRADRAPVRRHDQTSGNADEDETLAGGLRYPDETLPEAHK